MLRTTLRRSLVLDAPEPPTHVSAPRGLVRAGAWLYVIADDASHLAAFPAEGDAPGHRVRLSSDASQPHHVETLCRLPPLTGLPHGALLALPSGSTESRRTGALVPLAEDGSLAGEARAVDFTTLYTQLSRELGPLHVAGAAMTGTRLLLLNRASGPHGADALVDLDAERTLRALEAGSVGANVVRTVQRWELGQRGGVRLSFTGAAPLPDGRIVFTASVEDPHAGGPVKGSVAGLLAPDGSPLFLDALDTPVTPGGVEARLEAGRILLLLAAGAALLETALPGAPG